MLTLRRVFQAFATLAALGLCSAGAAGCGGKPTPPAGAPVGKSPADAPDEDKIPADAPVVSLTADEFFQEVRKDEKAAAEQFKNKRIELSGEVSSFMGFFEPTPGHTHAAVGLAVKGQRTNNLYCFLTNNDKQPWANLAAGQMVKLKGYYPENQNPGHPAIRQCVIVEHGPSTAVVLSAAQLAKEYSVAKDATEAKYKMKGVVVTGDIVSKKQPPFGGPLVSLKGNDKYQVECRMVEARWMTDPLMVGQKVKLYGVFEDLQGNDKVVKLGSCLVISRP